MLELGVGGTAVPGGLLDGRHRVTRAAVDVDRDALRDRRYPRAELFGMTEVPVCAKSPEKRLLERILRPLAPEAPHEQPVDACALRGIELLERWDVHGAHHLLKRRGASRCETRPMRFAVVGHVEWVDFLVVDRLPSRGAIVQAGETWQEAAGGGADAAVQLAKLAGEATLFTALGDDDRGHRAKEQLEARGLRVEAAWRSDPQRRALCFLDAEGEWERTITLLGPKLVPHADDPLPWGELATTDGVYFTGGDPAALRLARKARVLVASSRELPTLVEAGVALDVLVASADDPNEVYRPGDLEPAPHVVVRTEGDRGGTSEPGGRFPAAPVPGQVVDTYGAGDAFAAGLTYGLAAGSRLPEALSLASRCGAAVVGGRGPYVGQLTSAI